MESSANWYSRVRRSLAVMSEVVGRGAHVRGPSSGQTVFDVAGFDVVDWAWAESVGVTETPIATHRVPRNRFEYLNTTKP